MFHVESSCETFHVKMSFICLKIQLLVDTFSFEWCRTKTNFDKKAKDNSEMLYSCLISGHPPPPPSWVCTLNLISYCRKMWTCSERQDFYYIFDDVPLRVVYYQLTSTDQASTGISQNMFFEHHFNFFLCVDNDIIYHYQSCSLQP